MRPRYGQDLQTLGLTSKRNSWHLHISRDAARTRYGMWQTVDGRTGGRRPTLTAAT